MRLARRVFVLWLAVLLPLPAHSQKIYTYVGRITADSFLLAWGTAAGEGNTIGRSSVPLGKPVVEVDGQQVSSERNWVEVKGLAPDRTYSYRLRIAGREVGKGTVRTYPETATRLCFFLIGDYGTGKPPQYEIAQAMWREFVKRQNSDSPVRFVLTTGDNIYPDAVFGMLPRNTGAKDRDWREKFFEPYEPLLKQIPFYPTLGNHDRGGEDGDADEDLPTYLDNFFSPSDGLMAHYTFSFGGLVDFFALDTTAMWTERPLVGSLAREGGQFRWLQAVLARARSPWKIAYFHHPPFNAGPEHEPGMASLAHVMRLFRTFGVQVAFSGHEHNFQFAQQGGAAGRTLYVISGAGGQVRTGNIRAAMSKANIAGAVAQRHFLLVEIEDRTLKITPLSSEPVVVRDKDNRPIPMPLVVRLPEPAP